VEDPALRAVSFDQVKQAYAEQIAALVEGGVDVLLVETIFDTLNCKAAIMAAREVAPEDPFIADTLGWIHFRRGEYNRALSLLRESADNIVKKGKGMVGRHSDSADTSLEGERQADDEKKRENLDLKS
jgi:hypothetical protein